MQLSCPAESRARGILLMRASTPSSRGLVRRRPAPTRRQRVPVIRGQVDLRLRGAEALFATAQTCFWWRRQTRRVRRPALSTPAHRRSVRRSAPCLDLTTHGAHPASRNYPQKTGEYCLRCSFNLTFPKEEDGVAGWTSPYHFGIDLGPLVLICENHRSVFLWRLMRGCLCVVTGLRRAGFTKGWL